MEVVLAAYVAVKMVACGLRHVCAALQPLMRQVFALLQPSAGRVYVSSRHAITQHTLSLVLNYLCRLRSKRPRLQASRPLRPSSQSSTACSTTSGA